MLQDTHIILSAAYSVMSHCSLCLNLICMMLSVETHLDSLYKDAELRFDCEFIGKEGAEEDWS